MPTPHGQPRYRAIADELRRRIATGAIPAGALIPSESALTAEFRVARGTIREAINVLRNEGLVLTEHGRGTYARLNLPIRRLGPDRYALESRLGAPHERGVSSSAEVEDSQQVDAIYREVAAAPELAELFQVEPGTMLLERRLLARICGVPHQLTTSYYLLDMVAGTPLANPDREPWPGGHIAQLQSLGVTVTGIREVIRARMPTADEMDRLQMTAGVPILALVRKTLSGDSTVEVSVEIAYPADRTELEYEIT